MKDRTSNANQLVQDLIKQLNLAAENDVEPGQDIKDAVFVAGCLLEKDYLDSLPSARDVPRLQHLAATESPLEDRFGSLVGAEYARAALGEAERQQLTEALVKLLDKPEPLSMIAAGAFARTDRLAAIPKLVEVLYQSAQNEPLLANEAVMAIWTILGRSVTAQMAGSDAVQGLVDAALGAVDYAGEVASDKIPPFPKLNAQQAASALRDQFRR